MLCYGGLPVGQRIWLTLPASFSQNRVEEPIQGEIMWSRGSATGVQFVDIASICAHGIEDLLSSYQEHARPAEVSLHQGMDETAETQESSDSAEARPCAGQNTLRFTLLAGGLRTFPVRSAPSPVAMPLRYWIFSGALHRLRHNR